MLNNFFRLTLSISTRALSRLSSTRNACASSSSSETSDSESEQEGPPPINYTLPQAAHPTAFAQPFAPPPGLFMPGWQMAPQMVPHPQQWPAGGGWQQTPYGSYAVEAH